jgi:hypothetical protein
MLSQTKRSKTHLDILKEVCAANNTTFINRVEMEKAVQNYTTSSLQVAIEYAEGGVEILQAFINLAKVEQKRHDTARKVCFFRY